MCVVTWDGKRHIMKSADGLPMSASTVEQFETVATPGDRIQIGRNVFSYLQKS